MLTIGKRARGGEMPGTGDDPVALLFSCHERIRSFSALALRLVRATTATPVEVAEAAARCARYFAIALPLHAADEDLSVRPRLERAAASGGRVPLRAALALMSEEHGPLQRLIDDELVPLWHLVTGAPERLPEVSVSLGRGSERLCALMDQHLPPEESLVFPSVRSGLEASALADIAAEMRARRASGI